MLLVDLCSNCDVDVDDDDAGGYNPGSTPGTPSVPEGMDEGPGIGSSEDGRMTKSAAAAIHARFDFLLLPAVPAKLGIAAAVVAGDEEGASASSAPLNTMSATLNSPQSTTPNAGSHPTVSQNVDVCMTYGRARSASGVPSPAAA